MTIAYWCVFIAMLLPYICTAISKGAGGYDAEANRQPRSWQANLKGVSGRLYHAHLNSFEAFSTFAAAVIIAHLVGQAAQNTVDYLAMGFIVARIGYIFAYYKDIPRLRTATWTLGFFCLVGLFVVSA